MIAAPGAGGIADGPYRHAPGIAGGHFPAFDMDSPFFAALTDLAGGDSGAFGQGVGQGAFPHGYLAGEFQKGVQISEVEFQAVGVLFGDDAPLEAFHGKGHGITGSFYIKTVVVAEIGPGYDRLGVLDAAGHGAGNGFPFDLGGCSGKGP